LKIENGKLKIKCVKDNTDQGEWVIENVKLKILMVSWSDLGKLVFFLKVKYRGMYMGKSEKWKGVRKNEGVKGWLNVIKCNVIRAGIDAHDTPRNTINISSK